MIERLDRHFGCAIKYCSTRSLFDRKDVHLLADIDRLSPLAGGDFEDDLQDSGISSFLRFSGERLFRDDQRFNLGQRQVDWMLARGLDRIDRDNDGRLIVCDWTNAGVLRQNDVADIRSN